MKTKKAWLLPLLAGALTLSGCSLFNNTGEYALASYETSYNQETGETIITFYFTDEDVDPFVVTIPQKVGADGVGINAAGVTAVLGDNGITVTIPYTDGSAPTTFVVPHGNNAADITGVAFEKDDEDNLYIVFSFSNGRDPLSVAFPAANGVASVTPNKEGGTTTITVTFTDPDMPPAVFSVKDGIGISSIAFDDEQSTPTHYCLVVTYSDGQQQKIMLERPISTHWYNGSGSPSTYPNNINTVNAIDGDYYLDVASGWVYLREDGGWFQLFCMKGSESGTAERYTVDFYPNGGYWGDDPTDIDRDRIRVDAGLTVDLADIPTPSHATASFLGWFTDPININAGQFTDLTVVTKNLSLYARWSE